MIEARIIALEARMTALEAALKSKATAPRSQAPVTVNLDDQYGDPIVKSDPKRWDGKSYVGHKFSECPADYLVMLAGLLDWQADKDEQSHHTYTSKSGKVIETAPLKRKDAARARGWAQRNREKLAQGLFHAVAPPPIEPDDMSDIPF